MLDVICQFNSGKVPSSVEYPGWDYSEGSADYEVRQLTYARLLDMNGDGVQELLIVADCDGIRGGPKSQPKLLSFPGPHRHLRQPNL